MLSERGGYVPLSSASRCIPYHLLSSWFAFLTVVLSAPVFSAQSLLSRLRKSGRIPLLWTVMAPDVNYRYLSTPEKVDRLRRLYQDSRLQQRCVQQLRVRIAEMTASRGLSLDTETTSNLHDIMMEEESEALRRLPQDSFQYIFWQH